MIHHLPHPGQHLARWALSVAVIASSRSSRCVRGPTHSPRSPPPTRRARRPRCPSVVILNRPISPVRATWCRHTAFELPMESTPDLSGVIFAEQHHAIRIAAHPRAASPRRRSALLARIRGLPASRPRRISAGSTAALWTKSNGLVRVDQRTSSAAHVAENFAQSLVHDG